MNKWDSIGNALRAHAQLDGEPAFRRPLVELIDDKRVLIENHCGITLYSGGEIIVKVCYGEIQIIGSHMRIGMMSGEQLVICGQIKQIALNKRSDL